MKFNDYQKISVLGTGMMGPGIALLFVRAGYQTTIWGPTAEFMQTGIDNYERNIDDMVNAGFMTPAEVEECKGNIRYTHDLADAVGSADFVCEAVPEILDLKQDLFAEMDKLAPAHTILTSNTSTLMPTDISKKMECNDRMLVAHFWNPAHLVPLVEICGHANTDPDKVAITMQIMQQIGKEPVHIKKEILGFLGNRIMHAMNREALALVSQGVCTPEDIDKVILTSFGPRFANLGLLEYLDFCGLEHIERIQNYLYPDLDTTPGPLPVIKQKVKDGELGCKSGKGLFDWSDRDKDGPRAHRDQEFIRRLKESNRNGA